MTETGPRTHLVAGLGCAAISIMLGWVSVTGSPSLRVPPAIGVLAAGVLAVAAARLFQLATRPKSGGDGFAALILAGMAGIGGWIAFGAGPRVCTAGLSVRELAPAAGLECRIPFGLGAVMTGLLALYCASRWIRGRES